MKCGDGRRVPDAGVELEGGVLKEDHPVAHDGEVVHNHRSEAVLGTRGRGVAGGTETGGGGEGGGGDTAVRIHEKIDQGWKMLNWRIRNVDAAAAAKQFVTRQGEGIRTWGAVCMETNGGLENRQVRISKKSLGM